MRRGSIFEIDFCMFSAKRSLISCTTDSSDSPVAVPSPSLPSDAMAIPTKTESGDVQPPDQALAKLLALTLQSVAPSDVFNGATVRRRFVGAVLEIIDRTATGHRTFTQGTMVSSSQEGEWTLPEGAALRSQSTLIARGERQVSIPQPRKAAAPDATAPAEGGRSTPPSYPHPSTTTQ